MLNCFTVVATTILKPEVSKGIKVDGLRVGDHLSIQFGSESTNNLYKVPVVEGGVVSESGGITLIERVSVRRSRYSPNLLEVIAPRPGDVWDRALLGIWIRIPWEVGESQTVEGASRLVEMTYQTKADYVREGLYVIPARGSISMAVKGRSLRYKFSYHGGKVVAQVLTTSAIKDDDEYELV